MGRETDVLMDFYNPTPEQKQELADAMSALRWSFLALVFMISSTVAQVVWLIFLLTDNPKTKLVFMIFVGSFVLAEYSKWCSKTSKPENWK